MIADAIVKADNEDKRMVTDKLRPLMTRVKGEDGQGDDVQGDDGQGDHVLGDDVQEDDGQEVDKFLTLHDGILHKVKGKCFQIMIKT